jgi:hypothetical protein
LNISLILPDPLISGSTISGVIAIKLVNAETKKLAREVEEEANRIVKENISSRH